MYDAGGPVRLNEFEQKQMVEHSHPLMRMSEGKAKEADECLMILEQELGRDAAGKFKTLLLSEGLTNAKAQAFTSTQIERMRARVKRDGVRVPLLGFDW